MLFGLPLSTFLWVIVVPLLGVIIALLYGLLYKDNGKWLTVEDIFKSDRKRGRAKNEK